MNTSKVLKILSSESKARIIIRLLSCECNGHLTSVNDLCDEFDLKQPNLSKHLMDLRANKIVKFEKIGKTSYYKIDENFKREHGKLIIAISENSNSDSLKMNKCS